MAKFKYIVDFDERGEFRARVENENWETVYEISLPIVVVECSECGALEGECEHESDLIEVHNNGIIDDGYMRHTGDIEGLEKYLKETHVMLKFDELELAS